MTTRNRELASIIDADGNITAGGTLTVSGATTTVSSTVETHADPLIELNTGAGSNSNDLGFVFERGSTGNNACLIWDESNDAFAVGTTTATGTSTGNMSYTVGDFLAGKVTVDSVLIDGTTIGHTSDTDLLTFADGLLTVAGEISVTTLDIGGTNVSSTAAELNILDGVNSTAAELNILDGVTATAAEINIIDGDTSATSTTLAAADRVVLNDGGTMKQVALSDFETFFESAIDTFSTIDINGGSIDGATLGTNSAITQAVIDDIDLNGKVITMTGSTDDTAALTVGTNGTLSIVTVDTAAAAANIQITADGTVDIDSAGVLTLDSGAAINIEPASGSAILLDGTISVDAGVVTGATSITSTAFVGDITGDVTGNTSGTAATVTTAAQTNITSLGTLTALTVDNIALDGNTMTTTSSDFILDASHDIVLDADGGNIKVKDAGTTFFDIQKSSDDAQILSRISDGDLVFRGNDGGSTITALTLDMSEAGAATFNDKIVATELDISGNADIDGTLEADVITVDGTALNEYIADTVGAMVGSNTESGIAVAYQDGDNTLDFTVATLNQDTTGLAGTATALATARTIGGTSFDGTANIAVATATEGTNVTVSANNSTDETVYPTFVDGATGTQGIETDTGLTYNPSTGMLTSTGLTGTLTGNVTGNVTGNTSGTALTVTQAAQTAITSVGTLTGLTVTSNATINGLTKLDNWGSASGHGRIEFGNSGEPYIQGIDTGNGGSGAYLKFGINTTDVIYIKSDYKVGIGTTSPSARLDIAGMVAGEQALLITSARNDALSNGLARVNITDPNCPFHALQIDHAGTSAGSGAALAVSGYVTVSKSARITQAALTSSSAAVAWDARTKSNAYHVTTENTTFSAPSNAVEGAIISVELAQGGTARTISWNTVFEFAASTAPTVTATASKTDIFSFRYNGSVWQEIGRVQNMAQT
jgi:hypothetical protein